MMQTSARPALREGVRITFDPARGRHALVYPEGVLLLNETALATVELCDGRRDVDGLVAALVPRFAHVNRGEVAALLEDLDARRLLRLDGCGNPVIVEHPVVGEHHTAQHEGLQRPAPPLGMVAELTYRCPLQCTYCANPVNLADYRSELGTDDWIRVIDQAHDLGILQLHFSGGEPLVRRDLAELVAAARSRGMYTNLITSGVPLAPARLESLVASGLDHFQLSIQDSEPAGAYAIAGRRTHERKLAVGKLVKQYGLPLTVNVVLHRSNVDHVGALAELAAQIGADRLELAHTQFYGWAWRNKQALMPSREQVVAADRATATARERYGDRLEIVYVAADYFDTRPKPCMNGWGARQLVVAPNGDVLPCLAAGQLPGPRPPNVGSAALDTIWYDSELFNRFRGTDWMPSPCRTCELREIDFGGCRCQAFQLTGDPAVTDPACELSPHHESMLASMASASSAPAAARRLP
jgi:pyrroloquinoline quinone biosynthesis protein E